MRERASTNTVALRTQLPGNLVEMSLQNNNSSLTMHVNVCSLAYSTPRDNLPLASALSFYVQRSTALLSHHKLQVTQPDANAIDNLNIFPFLNSKFVLDSLKAELPTYFTKSADLDPNF